VPPALVSEQDPLWSRPCLAYNLHAELDSRCREDFAELQGRLPLPASWALRRPPASLHVSVATVLSVREDYGNSKDVIWERWGQQWCDSFAKVAAVLAPFCIRFTKLQVSTAAVIAVAEPVAEVEKVRELAKDLLSRAGLKADQPSIVHCTLVRYGASGRGLRPLAGAAQLVEVSTETTVRHLVVSKELVYPSLVRESLAHLQLGTVSSSTTRPARRSKPGPQGRVTGAPWQEAHDGDAQHASGPHDRFPHDRIS
jgi:hypothetical protein